MPVASSEVRPGRQVAGQLENRFQRHRVLRHHLDHDRKRHAQLNAQDFLQPAPVAFSISLAAAFTSGMVPACPLK